MGLGLVVYGHGGRRGMGEKLLAGVVAVVSGSTDVGLGAGHVVRVRVVCRESPTA